MHKERPGYYSIERLFESLLPQLSKQYQIRIERVPCHGRTIIELLRNLIFTGRLRADVIHVTGDVYYCTLGIPRQRCVLTVQDLVSLNRLKGARLRVFTLLWYSLPLRWAQHVTAISEETQRQLERKFPSVVGKIKVIPGCVDEAFEESSRILHPGTDRPRVLQVGTGSNKNLNRVAVAASGLPLHLRIIGSLSDDQRTFLSTLDLEWSSAEQLSAGDLVKEYQTSDVLTFVSTYEGFGLPIVEAQAIGLPVLTSNIEPMTDVAGKGALLVDPYSEHEIRAGLERLLSSPDLLRRLIVLGKSNVERFDSRIIAEQYARIYSDILDSR
jgi:glycosyltransferase involved in cell wall biosynthesis